MTLFNPPNYSLGKGPAPHLIDEETKTQTGERTCTLSPYWENLTQNPHYQTLPLSTLSPQSLSLSPNAVFPRGGLQPCSWLPRLPAYMCCSAAGHHPIPHARKAAQVGAKEAFLGFAAPEWGGTGQPFWAVALPECPAAPGALLFS